MYSKDLKEPIILCGLGHSGTSMVKNLFDWHPQLYVAPPNELKFFRNLDYPNLFSGFGKNAIGPKGEKTGYEKDMARNIKYFLGHHYMNRHKLKDGFDLDAFKRNLQKCDPSDYRELFVCLVKEMAIATVDFDKNKVDEVRYLIKATRDEEYVQEWLSLFPDTKFVYILRNPYAHFVSARENYIKFFKKFPPFISFIKGMKYSYYWMEKYSRLYSDRFYVLIYDRFIQNHVEEMKRLAEFLGLEAVESLHYQTILGREHKGHSVFTGTSETRVISDPLTRWMNAISQFEIDLINKKFEKIIKDYGFEILDSSKSRSRFVLPIKGEGPLVYLKNRVTYLTP